MGLKRIVTNFIYSDNFVTSIKIGVKILLIIWAIGSTKNGLRVIFYNSVVFRPSKFIFRVSSD